MRRWGLVLLLVGCAPTVAALIKRPGETSADPYAPVNEGETGIVSYRVRSPVEAPFLDGRAEGQKMMFTACAGPYRLESEDTDSSRLGSWRIARFTCVNGPPVSQTERIAQRLSVATGCPREYVFVESTGPGIIRFSVCQARYVCGFGVDAGNECRLAQ